MVDLAVIDGVFFRLHYPRRWHSDQEEKEADIKADFEHWPHLVPEARYVDEMFNFKFSSATLKMPASTGWVALALTENPLLPGRMKSAVTKEVFSYNCIIYSN